MIYRLFVTKEATQDAEEGFEWYEKAQLGLGRKFLDEVDRYFKRIIKSPNQFPLEQSQHVAIIKKFPYKIAFELEHDRIIILAIYHHKRDSGKISGRNTTF
jgi:plasmid stabilization system protein ParE